MKIAFLFAGYSSQFVGMGKELYDKYRIVQEYFEEASNCLNINFVRLCFASSEAELREMFNAYTSIFLVNSSIAALLLEQEIHPNIVAGYNDGDMSALSFARCINFPDGLYFFSKFCSFYREYLDKNDYLAVRVVGPTTSELQTACLQARDAGKDVYISFYHGDDDHIIAGHAKGTEYVRDIMKNAQFDFISVENGLHSNLMNPVLDQLKVYLEKIDFHDLQVPLVSSFDGSLVSKGADARRYVERTINAPLVYYHLINRLDQYDLVIEIGGESLLHQKIKAQYPKKHIVTVKKCHDIATIKEIIHSA